MQFLYDNGGPYLKIYVNENNMNMNLSSDYDRNYDFDRNQHDLSSYNARDGLNNFLPNTQAQMSFNPMGQVSPPSKNSGIQSSVIHHLVSSLGPNKTGSYSPFGDTINNNAMPTAVTNSFINSAPIPTTNYPIRNQNSSPFNDNIADVNPAVESSNPLLSTSPASNITPAANVKKTRKVAEVKPMRMSYSDVVSKNAAANGQETIPTTGSTNSASSSPNTTLPVSSKTVKTDKSKFSGGSFEKKTQDGDQAKAKKSPTNTNMNGVGSGNGVDSKKVPTSFGKPEKPVTTQGSVYCAKKKTSQGIGSLASGKASLNPSETSRPFQHKHTSDSDDEDEDNSSMDESDEDFDDPTEYYNVRKNVYHGEHHNIEKIVSTKASTTYKKVKNTSATSAKKTEKASKRTTKTSSRKRQKHEVLLKLVVTWGEYLLKFVQWLWTLVYDVGYLSCGIIWDRMSWCYQCAVYGLDTVRQELSGSPGKAAWLWMKNCWKTFDGKFDKKSRWAFWRWMFKKKPPASEQVKDPYKDGKLPKTAEEAMKSLLNCKGKDAYR